MMGRGMPNSHNKIPLPMLIHSCCHGDNTDAQRFDVGSGSCDLTKSGAGHQQATLFPHLVCCGETGRSARRRVVVRCDATDPLIPPDAQPDRIGIVGATLLGLGRFAR